MSKWHGFTAFLYTLDNDCTCVGSQLQGQVSREYAVSSNDNIAAQAHPHNRVLCSQGAPCYGELMLGRDHHIPK